MLRSRLMYLLEKFETDRLTQAEQTELDKWFYEVSGQHRSSEGSITEEKITALSEEVWKEIQSRIGKTDTTSGKPIVRNFLRWVAAAILLLGIGGSMLFVNKEIGRVKSNSQSAERNNNIVNNMNTTQRFRLTDCSVIDLASGSQISYSSAFGRTKRSIELKGMAYFSVEKGQQLPFVVKTGSVSTTALGTSFTIDSRQEGTTLIKLHTGKVSVEFNKVDQAATPVIMHPGDSLQMNTITGKASLTIAKNISKQPVSNAKPPVPGPLLKSGYSATFNQTALPVVLKQIGEGYQIHVNLDSTELSDLYFTGKIKETDQLGTIIRRLEILHNLRIKINNKELVIQKK